MITFMIIGGAVIRSPLIILQPISIFPYCLFKRAAFEILLIASVLKMGIKTFLSRFVYVA